MIIRLLLLFAVMGFILYLAIRIINLIYPQQKEGQKEKKKDIHNLVSCKHCQTFIPKSQAKQIQTEYYCPEHAPRI